MAAFDQERGCLVARLVYDGPAHGGKTTNLQTICELVPAERRSEVYTPGAMKGRTMFFDWLELEAPRSVKTPLRYQLITVPGQRQRNYRRRPLVEMADVVVFVCDCSPERLAESTYTFGRLETFLARRGGTVPLIVQANKQDVDGALLPEEVREVLGLGADVPIVPSVAAGGVGVRETLTLAMKAGLQVIQRDQRAKRIRRMAANAADADALFNTMLDLEERMAGQNSDV